MAFPHHAFLFWIFVPPQAIGLPSDGDEVRRTIVVDVDGPFAAVGNKLSLSFYFAVLVAVPDAL